MKHEGTLERVLAEAERDLEAARNENRMLRAELAVRRSGHCKASSKRWGWPCCLGGAHDVHVSVAHFEASNVNAVVAVWGRSASGPVVAEAKPGNGGLK